MNFIKNYFKFDERKATFKKEIIGGISTFLAMAYILAVNPSIVGDSLMNPGSTETAASLSGGLFLATAISAFFGTMLMGL
jgi:AGZA family xanthine/uracil permease-like MFS transporter